MSDILQKIFATKYREVADARQQFPLEMMRERAISAPPPRDFVGAIRAKHAANSMMRAAVRVMGITSGTG